MLALLGRHKPDFLFLHLLLNRLPTQVQAVLANAAITGCWAAAEEADKIFLVSFQHCVTARASARVFFCLFVCFSFKPVLFSSPGMQRERTECLSGAETGFINQMLKKR